MLDNKTYNMTRLVAYVCYFLRLHLLAYFLNRKRKRVVTFHNVLPDDIYEKNIANGVSCSFSEFKTIIKEISRFYRFSLDLDDCKTVTLTFDDGYLNQVETAASYLLGKGIPAYLFVSGQLLENTDEGVKREGRPLVVDLLLHWISYVPNGAYKLDICDWGGEISDGNRLQIWTQVLWPAFLKDARQKGQNLLNALDAAYPLETIIKSLPKRYVKQRLGSPSVGQLDELRDKGWEIGWHTYSHYPLAKLTREEKQKELSTALKCIGGVMSFPYGGPQEVDAECIEIVKSLNYSAAVSNVSVANELSGNYFRARMSLSPEPALLHFELSGLKYMMKYRRLLPKL